MRNGGTMAFNPSLATWIVGTVVVGGAAAGGYAVLTTSGPFTEDSSQSPATVTVGTDPPPREVEVRTVPLEPAPGIGAIAPDAVALDTNGNLYIADFEARRIYVQRRGGRVEVLAGSGEQGIADGPALSAQFMGPSGLAVTSDGSVFVVDSPAHRIRRIDPTGVVSTFAGGGGVGLGEGELRDGQGSEARFNLPAQIALDPRGDFIVTDKDNSSIRRITASGVVTTIAGPSQGGSDGAAPKGPVGLAVADDGTIYFTDHRSNSVNRLTVGGSLEVLTSSIPGPITGGNPVNGASIALSFPSGVSVLADGSLLVADTQGNRLVRFSTAGNVVQIIGDSAPGNSDGNGASARFKAPVKFLIRPTGEVLVVDSGNDRLRSISGLAP
jgi:sugar lactone lactonase YvrE